MSTSAGKRLWKQYVALTRVERVNLILAAEEEEDQDEMLALENTCSEEETRCVYGHLVRLSCAASAVVIQLLALEVLMVKRIEDLLGRVEASGRDEGDEKGAAGSASSGWARIGEDEKLAALMEEAATSWLGFSRWCWEVGHDPHQVLRLAPMGSTEAGLPYTILRDQIEYSERWASQLLPDPDHANPFYQLLSRGFWSIGY